MILIDAVDLPPPLADTVALSASHDRGAKALVVRVRSTLPSDLRCPHCGGERRPNGTRVVRFRDVPFRGAPVFIDWKRQQYRCFGGCGRTSAELHPEFVQDRYLTRRLSAWVLQEGARTPFRTLAEASGINERRVREIFHREARTLNLDLAATKVVAFHNIPLAARDRPAVIDVEKRAFLDVLSSSASLADEFAIWKLSDRPVGSHVEFAVLDIALFAYEGFSNAYFKALFPDATLLVSGLSVAREATKLIGEACRSLFASTAAHEKLATKSALALFRREGRSLMPHAKQRLATWRDIAPKLYDVYELKERLATLVRTRSLNEPQWESWRAAAEAASSVNLGPAIELVESHWDQLVLYQSVIEMIFFEEWFERATSNLEIHGGHSFAAARIAFLEQSKPRQFRRPES